jgi:hypothetical protein
VHLYSTHHEKALRIPNFGSRKSLNPKLCGKTECCGVESDEAGLNTADTCRLSGRGRGYGNELPDLLRNRLSRSRYGDDHVFAGQSGMDLDKRVHFNGSTRSLH